MHKRLERGDRVITERDLVLKEYEIVRVTKLTAVGQRGDTVRLNSPVNLSQETRSVTHFTVTVFMRGMILL